MFSSLLLTAVVLIAFASVTIIADDPSSDVESVTIYPWQFCQGCKHTVSLYTKVTSDQLLQMKKKGAPSKAPLEGTKIAEKICDDPSFYNLQPFMRWGCVKIMSEHAQDFLQEFSGQFNANDLRNKADNFKRTRRICGKHTKACDQHEFQRANITSSHRTKCNACRLIAEEIEMSDRMMAKNVTLKSFLKDDFCQSLGYRFLPYQWLETVCEDMVEDKLDDIIGVLDFQKGFRATGLNPDKSTADMMCEEFFKCPIAPRASAQEEL